MNVGLVMTEEELEVLRDTIREGMCYHVSNPDGPDYRCIHCLAEPIGGQYNPITHRVDCSGVVSLAILGVKSA